MNIPEKFYKGTHPIAKTVRDLKRLLKELPEDLQIEQGFGYGVEVVVYNYDSADMHVGFREIE